MFFLSHPHTIGQEEHRILVWEFEHISILNLLTSVDCFVFLYWVEASIQYCETKFRSLCVFRLFQFVFVCLHAFVLPPGCSRGPSPLTMGAQDTLPVAAAFTETVNAFFKGADPSKQVNKKLHTFKTYPVIIYYSRIPLTRITIFLFFLCVADVKKHFIQQYLKDNTGVGNTLLNSLTI